MSNDNEILRRIERLEEAFAGGYGDAALRRDTQAALRDIVREARERIAQRLEAQTERILFTGTNADEVNEWAGDEGMVRTDHDGAKWLVGHAVDGQTIELKPGTWLARDPRHHVLYETRPIGAAV